MSMWIRAAVTPGRGEPFRIEKVELEDCRPDELIVDIKAAGICHTDEAAQMQQLPVPLPAVLGHEGAGVVAKVGSAVTDFAVGDHVVLSFASCGKCGPCTEGRPYACEKMFEMNFCGMMPDGTRRMYWEGQALGAFFSQSSFATQCAVKARSAVKIDKEIDLTVAAPFGCGVQTGAGIVLNCLKPPFGSQLAVFGCGTVGMAALMAARIAGCKTIIAVGGNSKSLALAKELGATHTINRKEVDDIAAAVREITGGGADYVIDTSGVQPMIEAGLNALNYLGTLVMAGAGSVIPPNTALAAKTVMGVTEGHSVPRAFIPKLLDYYRAGRFPVDKLIHTYPFEEINAAFAASHRGDVIKAVLEVE